MHGQHIWHQQLDAQQCFHHQQLQIQLQPLQEQLKFCLMRLPNIIGQLKLQQELQPQLQTLHLQLVH